jgi:ectoine hydroxylase-related dioxygenase (phytanoyl-CoA dioxygenase family)
MITYQQRQTFRRDGYLLLPGVLAPEKVKALRSFLEPRFLAGAGERLPGESDAAIVNVFARFSEVRSVLFEPAIAEAMRGLLGDDFVVLVENGAHRGLYSPWHKDTNSCENTGASYLWDDDYLMVQCAFYLQDNDSDAGGGLDVVPGSHLVPNMNKMFLKTYVRGQVTAVGLDNVPKLLARELWRRVRPNGKDDLPGAVSIPSKAGDMLIFHQRISHRATRVKTAKAGSPIKLAIFQGFSANSRHVALFTDFLRRRPDYGWLRGYSHPEDFRRAALSRGLHLAC